MMSKNKFHMPYKNTDPQHEAVNDKKPFLENSEDLSKIRNYGNRRVSTFLLVWIVSLSPHKHTIALCNKLRHQIPTHKASYNTAL